MESRSTLQGAHHEFAGEISPNPRRGAVGKLLDVIRRTGESRLFWLIALIVVVTRLLFYLIVFEGFKDEFGWLRDDSYDEIATNVLSGHGYVTDPGGAPNTDRTPLYTYFLVLQFMAFGNSRIALVIVQSILQAGACIILFKIARDYLHDRAFAFLVSVAMAFYPQSMLYASQYLTESLYLLVMMATVYFFFRLTGDRFRGSYLALGALMAILTLCKPISQFLILPIVLMIGYLFREQKWLALKGIGKVIIAFVVIISPWTVRNYVVTGDFIPVSTRGGRFLYSNTIESLAEEVEVLKEIEGGEISPGAEESRWFAFALRNILDRPGRFLQNSFRTGLDFWYRGHSKPVSTFNALVNFPILFFGVLGMVAARRRGLLILPSLVIILYYNGVYSLLHAIARYSLPVIPIVLMFAVIGIVHLIDPTQLTPDEEQEQR